MKQVGGTGNEYIRDLADTANAVYLAGEFSGTGSGPLAGLTSASVSNDAMLAALDPTTGTALWARIRSGNNSDGAYGIAAGSGAVYVGGYYAGLPSSGFLFGLPESSGTTADGFLVSFTP